MNGLLFLFAWLVIWSGILIGLTRHTDCQQRGNSEYRQMFQHDDGENVSQISVGAEDSRVRVYGSMSAPQSFRYYYWQFLKEFAVDATPWARDNMILAGTMAVIPGFAVYWVDRSHSVDWPVIKTTLWLYGGALLIYLGIHMVRTPWKLNRRHIAEIQEAKDRETVLLKQIEELTPKQSIRQQTFSLAESVLNFAYQRSSGAPHPPAWTP